MACTLVFGAQGCNPRRGDEFYAASQQSGTCWNSSKHNTRSITQMMRMNWNVVVSLTKRKHVSQSTMIKAKIIMKERVWTNRMINETTSVIHCEATGYLLPFRQHRNVEDCRVHRTERASMVSIRTVAIVTLDFRRRRSLVT